MFSSDGPHRSLGERVALLRGFAHAIRRGPPRAHHRARIPRRTSTQARRARVCETDGRHAAAPPVLLRAPRVALGDARIQASGTRLLFAKSSRRRLDDGHGRARDVRVDVRVVRAEVFRDERVRLRGVPRAEHQTILGRDEPVKLFEPFGRASEGHAAGTATRLLTLRRRRRALRRRHGARVLRQRLFVFRGVLFFALEVRARVGVRGGAQIQIHGDWSLFRFFFFLARRR